MKMEAKINKVDGGEGRDEITFSNLTAGSRPCSALVV